MNPSKFILFFLMITISNPAFSLDIAEIKSLTTYSDDKDECGDQGAAGSKFDPESPFEASEGYLVGRKKVSFFDKLVVKAPRKEIPHYECSLRVINGDNVKISVTKGSFFRIVQKLDRYGQIKVIRHCKTGTEFVIDCPNIFVEKNKITSLKVTSQDVVDAFGEYFDFHIVTAEDVLD